MTKVFDFRDGKKISKPIRKSTGNFPLQRLTLILLGCYFFSDVTVVQSMSTISKISNENDLYETEKVARSNEILMRDSQSSAHFSSQNIIATNPPHLIHRILENNSNFTNITAKPTVRPTKHPTDVPTKNPIHVPSKGPSKIPTKKPTDFPTNDPSIELSMKPTVSPSSIPSKNPSELPSLTPSDSPSQVLSEVPTQMSSETPSQVPTELPSETPTQIPSGIPTLVSSSFPTSLPSEVPSQFPSEVSTKFPSLIPTKLPSEVPSGIPSNGPSLAPTLNPTKVPSNIPSTLPSDLPTVVQSITPTQVPSFNPSVSPSFTPSETPTSFPTGAPSEGPTQIPTSKPTVKPSIVPTLLPTTTPSVSPSIESSAFPTNTPSSLSTSVPSLRPSQVPSQSMVAFSTSFGLKLQFVSDIMANADQSLFESEVNSFLFGLFTVAIPSFRRIETTVMEQQLLMSESNNGGRKLLRRLQPSQPQHDLQIKLSIELYHLGVTSDESIESYLEQIWSVQGSWLGNLLRESGSEYFANVVDIAPFDHAQTQQILGENIEKKERREQKRTSALFFIAVGFGCGFVITVSIVFVLRKRLRKKEDRLDAQRYLDPFPAEAEQQIMNCGSISTKFSVQGEEVVNCDYISPTNSSVERESYYEYSVDESAQNSVISSTPASVIGYTPDQFEDLLTSLTREDSNDSSSKSNLMSPLSSTSLYEELERTAFQEAEKESSAEQDEKSNSSDKISQRSNKSDNEETCEIIRPIAAVFNFNGME